MAYTKGETLKLTMFWSTILCILFLIIESILSMAYLDAHTNGLEGGMIAMFVFGVVCAVIALGTWIYVKVKKTNRKLTA